MKSKIFLRIASIVLILHLAGHLVGHLTWRDPEDPNQQKVVRYMTEFRFPFMGAVHSIGDYYEGYGWGSSISLLFFALVFWIASTANEREKLLSKRMTLALSFSLVAWGVMEIVYFFPFAASLTWIAALFGLIGSRDKFLVTK